jgi:hypothetical protein
MKYDYLLYVDEAGDDKLRSLRPDDRNGNSEWLCLGGYLVRADSEHEMPERRDALLESIGGVAGNVLHFKKYTSKNQKLICEKLSEFSARGFVVCSFKKTMLGHSNPRAAAAGTANSDSQYFFNWLLRLLFERVTTFVSLDAKKKGIESPKIKLIVASRKGHHFGHFQAYVHQLRAQATAGSTFLATQEIKPDVLSRNLLVEEIASKEPGLQLADAVVSATFQSIERLAVSYKHKPALGLKPIMANNPNAWGKSKISSNFGMTLFHPTKAPPLLTIDQKQFFNSFGYTLN